MKRSQNIWLWTAVLLTVMPGCYRTRNFYFFEDGDLSHYRGVATEIEYPDAESILHPEVAATPPPPPIDFTDYETWDMSLEEAVQIALANSEVVRLLRGDGRINEAFVAEEVEGLAGEGRADAARLAASIAAVGYGRARDWTAALEWLARAA